MKSAGCRAAPVAAPAVRKPRPAILVISDVRLVHSVIAPALRDAGVHVQIADAATHLPAGVRASAFDVVLVGGARAPDGRVKVGAVPLDACKRDGRRLVARPGCAAERWAVLVLKVREADADPRTLGDWAGFVGMSQSSLCECCRLVDVRPQAARDLARVLRAVIRSSADDTHPAMLLDVSDRRTLRRLLARAGLEEGRPASVDTFLDRQQIVHPSNTAFTALRRLLGAT